MVSEAKQNDGAQPASAGANRPSRGGGERLFTPVFIAIIAITLCCFIVGQGLNAGTTVYVTKLGETATFAGVSAGVFSVAAIVGRLVSGPLADARGRLIVIVASCLVLLAGVLGAALVTDIRLMMVWRVLQGLGFSGVTTAAATAAADVLPIERLGEGIGYYGVGQALAMSVGPALGIALVSTDPPENLYWGLTVVVVVGLALCLLCRYEKNPQRLPETATYRTRAEAQLEAESNPQKASDTDDAHEPGSEEHEQAAGGFLRRVVEPGALAGGIPILLFAPMAGFGIYFIGLVGSELGIGNAGLFFTTAAIMMITVRVLSKAFMNRFAALKLYAFAIAMGVVGYAMLFYVTSQPVDGVAKDVLFYGAGIFYGVCLGMSLPVNQAVAVQNSPAERWGVANGLFLLMFDVGIGIASVVWGITNDVMGIPFTTGCVIVLLVVSFATACVTYPPFARR